MSDEATPGVLLKGADGSQFFIPHTDMSKYAVGSGSAGGGGQESEALRVDAFAVQRTADETAAVAFMPMPEGATAFMPMPEG